MFNTPNDCFISSPSSPSGLIFNRQNHNSRYHPYSRIPPTYYSPNELETYSYDNNNNNNSNNNNTHHNHNSTIPNYDHSIMSYDYNLGWTTTSSSIDNEMGIDGQTTMGTNIGGTGRVKFPLLFLLFSSTEIFFIHSKVLLVVSNDVSQPIKKNAVVHNL